ncbi:hypothetical protein FQR65_LT12514 [Abscondita terminalis]|nr:hypothetical protein FQR65_LT12514 [Abscondita terminalis]
MLPHTHQREHKFVIGIESVENWGLSCSALRSRQKVKTSVGSMEKTPLNVFQDNTFEGDIDVKKKHLPRINLNSTTVIENGDDQENIDPSEISFSRTLTPEAFASIAEDVTSTETSKPRTSLLLNFDPLFSKNESFNCSSNLCAISENNEMDYLISSLCKLQVENKNENVQTSEHSLNSGCIKIDDTINDLNENEEDNKLVDEQNLNVTHNLNINTKETVENFLNITHFASAGSDAHIQKSNKLLSEKLVDVTQNLNTTEDENNENAFNSTYPTVVSINTNSGDPKVNLTSQNTMVYLENALNSECSLNRSCKIIETDDDINVLTEDCGKSKIMEENNVNVTQNLNGSVVANLEVDVNLATSQTHTLNNSLNSSYKANDLSENDATSKIIDENNPNVTQNFILNINSEEILNSTFSAVNAINANLAAQQVNSVTGNITNSVESHETNVSTGTADVESIESSPCLHFALEAHTVNTENVCNNTLTSNVKNSDHLEDELSTSEAIASVKTNNILDKNGTIDNLENTINISEGSSVDILEVNISDNQPESFISEPNISENYSNNLSSIITITDISGEHVEQNKNYEGEINETDIVSGRKLSEEVLTSTLNDHLPMKIEYVQPNSMTCDSNEELLMLNSKVISMEEEIKLLKLELTESQQSCTNLERELNQKNECFDKEIKKVMLLLEEKNNNIEELQQNIKELKLEEQKLRTNLEKNTCDIVGYRRVIEGYEKTMKTKFSQFEKLQQDHRVTNQHLLTLEVAFSDLHQKYERSKQIIQGYKSNEATLVDSLNHAEICLKKSEEKYEALKTHAKDKLEMANRDILKMRDEYETEMHKLTTLVKRLEIKLSSQTDLLNQKQKECAALAVLCDEVTGKV